MKIKKEDLQNLVHYLKVPNINGISRHILDRFIRRIHSVNEFELTDDVLTIEHLYSVKKMVDDMILLREKFDGKIDEGLVYEYLLNKTYCVYKFDIAEKELHG